MNKVEQYLSQRELSQLGLASCGRHVFVSRLATLAAPELLHIGDMVRIDAFTTITGSERVSIGHHVHLGSSVTINASAEVMIGNYSGISAGVKLFTTDDDYSGLYLTGPTVSTEYSNIKTASVELMEHCIIGANSVILPGSVLEDGAAVGALSLISGRLSAWGIYGGIPARLLKPRSNKLLEKAAAMEAQHGNS